MFSRFFINRPIFASVLSIIIVLGGGIGSNPLLLRPVRGAAASLVPITARIETSLLGERAALQGAIAAALNAAGVPGVAAGVPGVAAGVPVAPPVGKASPRIDARICSNREWPAICTLACSTSTMRPCTEL